MTEECREWVRMNKQRFMQKYYQKGGFFLEKADDCDFSTPTGEDMMDKTILPKVMQVKRFGFKGRMKWTDLVNEDTTDWNNPYVCFAC
uniref:Micro-fibrillar-associated protein 1 C-terminal domain-containing protein n=1 Tax=Oryza nivara TaxID=4536 RepID=A0A0E0HQA9_ORYNI